MITVIVWGTGALTTTIVDLVQVMLLAALSTVLLPRLHNRVLW